MLYVRDHGTLCSKFGHKYQDESTGMIKKNACLFSKNLNNEDTMTKIKLIIYSFANFIA